MSDVSEATTTRIVCTNLNQAQAGQWVKLGNTKRGLQAVRQIEAMHKNGNIKLDKWSVFKPEPSGIRAYKTGEGNRIGGYTVLTHFAEGETVESVEQAIITAQDVDRASARRQGCGPRGRGAGED